MNNYIIISGCSGGGKSTLLAELKRRGYTVMEEPGRRVVEIERRCGGDALPWINMKAFLHRVIDLALEDLAGAAHLKGQWVFFDRSLVDAAAALQELTGNLILDSLCKANQYHQTVFLAPPWPEIYEQDAERRHDMDAALVEFERLKRAYPAQGYRVLMLPKVSVSERADYVLNALAER